MTNTTIGQKFARIVLAGLCLLFLPSTGQSQLATNTSGGRFLRGSGTNEELMSVVIPLSFEKGMPLPLMDTQIVGTNYFPWNSTNGQYYQFNGTNAATQTGTSGRILFNQNIVAFGSRAGGNSLYYGQSYAFGIYAGSPASYSNSLRIVVYRKSDFTLVDTVYVSIPNPASNTNEWMTFLTNGYTKTVTAYGLTTALQFDNPLQMWGITSSGTYHLIHKADSSAGAYVFQVEFMGVNSRGNMVLNNGGVIWWSRLYSVEFEARPAWRSVFIDQPQFQGKPMPPSYDGKSVDELMTNPPPVTNIVSLPQGASTYTNLDQSPELRRHPILDQFVSDMRNDPVALAAYVQNEIGLVDALAMNDNGPINDQSVNLGGVNRSALTTYLEGQGSPAEQCALLVYLLRQAGFPAVYIYAPEDKLQMLDTRLSKILGMQLKGAVDFQTGNTFTSNRLIAVNYPWVATYVSNQWVHVFPWIKDSRIVEGLNLWDVMPTNYPNAYTWILDYVKGNTNLLSLASENSPGAIFPAYLKRTLLQNYPGVSVDDIGVQVVNRRHSYLRWSDFPRPTYVTNFSYAVESFSDPAITNASPGLTNIFDLVNVRVYSQSTTNRQIITGDLRMADILNRKFLLRFEKITSTTHRMILSMEPYRTNVAGIGAFTNDAALLKQQSVTNTTLVSTDDVINVSITYKRHRALAPTSQFGFLDVAEPNVVVTNQASLRKGDLAALCFNVGTISKKMLAVHAQEYWNMEQQLKSNPSLTNSTSPEIYQGTAAYLMGMAYYERISRFRTLNEHLQKAKILSVYSFGLSKLSAQRTGGSLPNGDIDLIQPQVDMVDQEIVFTGNRTLHPDSGNDLYASDANLSILDTANSSAQEHQIINSYFQQADAISTIKLLQLAQNRATNRPGIYILNKMNYLNYGTSNYLGVALKSADTNMWKTITNSFVTASEQNFMQWIVTPGNITNNAGSYKGMGGFLIQIPEAYGAIISPNQLNGGSGENFPGGTFGLGNMLNLQVDVDNYGDYIFNYNSATSTRMVSLDNPASFLTPTVANNANSGLYSLTDFQNLYGNIAGSLYNGTPGTFGNGLLTADQYGMQGQSSFYDGIGLNLAEPVNGVTGEFYVDETDLVLPGPMPLTVRRNYSSQNVAANQFGIGWKLSYMPFLSINNDASVIYASEADGSVIAYQSVTNNLWVPSANRNPDLNTFTTHGMGSTANLFAGKIVKQQIGTNTFYTLYAPDGSQRIFQVMTFASAVTSTRPYLIQWLDNRGNYYTCQYGTDPAQADFGQARRIQSSNGSFLGFYYDVYGHITDVYAGDGRRLHYDYDELGDLVTVTLPDASQINYTYEHKNQSVTNGSVVAQVPYSTHLILQEIKPDGRETDNQYDSQRRVTNQLATIGQDLNLIRSVSFVYSNNFVLTNSFTNGITGTTFIIDMNNRTSRYDYAGGEITNILDQSGQNIVQLWYSDSATPPGYPRSLWKRKDKRGLWTEFQYDTAGNVTNSIVSGDITGNGNTNEQAVTSTTYNTNNLPLLVTDPATNITQYIYDPVYPFLPQQIVRISGGVSVSTTFMTYQSVTNILVNGNLTVTNIAVGVLQRQVRAYGSPDAATTDWVYDGRGFPVQQIKYSGTTDSNVVLNLTYNARNELIEQRDTANRSARFDYDGMGRLTAKETYDENGNIVEWKYSYYNPNGDLVWADGPRSNPEDYVWRDYDGGGRLTQEIHWRSRAKADGTGVEAETGDALYATTFYQYDSFGNLTNTIDPRQNYALMNYDAVGRVVQRRSYDTNNALLKTEGFSYEPGGQVATVTNAMNGVTTTLYTSTGQPKTRNNPDGTVNQWRYYMDGRIAQEIQPNGAYWQYSYDNVNRTVTRTFLNAGFAASPQEIKQFDRRGNVVVLTDVDNNVFTTSYDGLDRVKVSSGPATTATSSQQTTTYVYDDSGKVQTVINGLGEKTITTFDAVGRPVSVEIRDASNTLVRKTATSYPLDHNSVTTTEGTVNQITTTVFSDTYGKPVLTQRFPGGGVTERTINVYDISENLLSAIESSIQGGTVTTYSMSAFSYDGLNRVKTQTKNGSEATTFIYNPAGVVTNRAMPGPLTWIASYDSASRITHEELRGSDQLANRVFNYSYYTSGTNIALLQTVSDPRSVTFNCVYDGFRRLGSKSSTGSAEQNMSTFYQYDNRGHAISISQTTSGQPSTSIARTFDGYGQLTDEQVYINGLLNREVSQQWDAAGRRSQLNGEPAFPQGQGAGRAISYGYRADGLMTSLNPGGAGYAFNYGDNGLLTSRSNPFRTATIASRDGMGRILSMTNRVNGASQLQETLAWRPDGKLTNYVGARPGFNDARTYAYNYSQVNRLTTETMPLLPGEATTTFFQYEYDFASAGGPGIRSQLLMTNGSYLNNWVIGNNSTYLDPMRRIIRENENYVARRASVGTASDVAYLTSSLDGRVSKNVDYDPVSDNWRTILELIYIDGFSYSKHIMRGFHPTGVATAVKTNQYANNALDHYDNAYDGFGNQTMHRLRASSGTYLSTHTLTWDAEGRLIKDANRDDVNDGFDWTALYDGLGRRLRTTHTPIIGGVSRTNITLMLDSWYDPQVKFLEIAVAVNGQRTWKVYGPDISQGVAMQGVGGFETTVREYDGYSVGLLNDYLGNAVAMITNNVTTFGGRVTGYGPIASQQLPLLSPYVSVAEATIWRGKRVDPTGFYWMGGRYYDPNAARFISPEPLGHSKSIDLYSAFAGDPVNLFDPDGRGPQPQISGFTYDLNAGRVASFQYQYPGLPVSYGPEHFSFDNWCLTSWSEPIYPYDYNWAAKAMSDKLLADTYALQKAYPLPKPQYINDGPILSADMDFVNAATFVSGVRVVTGLAGGAYQYAFNNVSRNLTFGTGAEAEAYLASKYGGTLQVPLDPPTGRLVVDQLSGPVAYESKVGFQAFNERNLTQITKYGESLEAGLGDIEQVEYNLFRSGITGRVGADARNLALMDSWGIDYTIYSGLPAIPESGLFAGGLTFDIGVNLGKKQH